jgi:hypothetical protein
MDAAVDNDSFDYLISADVMESSGVIPKSPLSNVASAIVGAMQTWERKPADFYPTPADVTYSLVPHIMDILPVGSSVLEPACGDGAMAEVLLACGYKVDATELREDSGYGSGGVDFLKSNVAGNGYDAIITNPPFIVADQFIRHAVGQARVVAMLLKSQYWHAAKRLKLFDDHPPARIYPLTWRPSFLEKERGNSPLMDVLWTVWDADHVGDPTYHPIRRLSSNILAERDEFEALL